MATMTVEVPGLRVTEHLGVGIAFLAGSPSLAVPERWTVEANWARVPHALRLEVQVVDGRPRCSSLTCLKREGGAAITDSSIRHLRIADIISYSAQLVLRDAKEQPDGTWAMEPRVPEGAVGDVELVRENQRALSKVRRIPRGRHVLTDKFLKELAGGYRLAVERNVRSPAQELAQAYSLRVGHDVPRTTVHRWIAEARRRGMLGSTAPGKKGENPHTRDTVHRVRHPDAAR